MLKPLSFKKFKEYGFEIDYSLSDELGHGIDDNGLAEGIEFIEKTLNI